MPRRGASGKSSSEFSVHRKVSAARHQMRCASLMFRALMAASKLSRCVIQMRPNACSKLSRYCSLSYCGMSLMLVVVKMAGL